MKIGVRINMNMNRHDSVSGRAPGPVAARLVGVVFAVGLLASACGTSGSNSATLSDGRLVVDATATQSEPATGTTPVDFRYDTLDGGTAALSELGDKPVVVNFFASWCPACIAEMPDFEEVHQAMSADVDFLGLALQDRPESARALVADTGVTYAVGTDEGEIFELFKGLGMPTTVLIGADGVVLDVHSGQLSADALREKIDDVLLS